MRFTFFPDPIFGWVFLGFLTVLMLVAAWMDTRWLKLPKWLSLAVLGFGVVVNIIRGSWLGAIGEQVYLFAPNGMLVGALDGFIFAAVGFAVGFALFFVMWLLGVCGGGDVKLFAALGACIGVMPLLFVLFGTAVFVAFIVVARFGWAMATGKGYQLQRQMKKAHEKRQAGAAPQAKHRIVGFALPLALACFVVLPWLFRYDLNLAGPRPQGNVVEQAQ